MVTGKVIRFDDIRGYGFVAPDGGGEDVFVHANDLEFDKGLMARGIRVEFLMGEGERGPKASAVRFLEGAAAAPRQSTGGSGGEMDDGALCDVLSPQEFLDEVTEVLLAGVPSMTGEQVLQARQRLLRKVQEHGWVDTYGRSGEHRSASVRDED